MRILLLSYCFPPVPLIEAQVTAKVSGHLDAEVDVVAADPGLWRLAADHSLDDHVAQRFRSVTRVRRVGGPALVATTGRLPRLFNRPDALAYLNRVVLSELRHRRLADYDLLVTRSQFHSIHLAALALSSRPPWVAHFSDPWVGNPARPEGAIARALNRRREAAVLAAADRLVFTSEVAADFTLRGQPGAIRAKARAVPHCYVPELYPSDIGRPDDSGPILARHVGHLRRNRHPEPLLRALAELERRRPGALGELRVELIGLISPEMLDSDAARSLPPGLVRTHAPVDYRSSLAAMRGAELLLLTETHRSLGVDLHAKIVDYAGAGVPIVGIAPPGPTASLIAALGGWHARPDRPQDGADALEQGIAQARRRRSAPIFTPWGTASVRERYAAQVVGRELTEIYGGTAC